MKVVAFADESGNPRPCRFFTVACVCFRVERGVSYYVAGRGLAARVARILRLERAHELKYTAARRRGRAAVEHALRLICDEARVAVARIHATGVYDRERGIKSLVNVLLRETNLQYFTLVVDEAPLT